MKLELDGADYFSDPSCGNPLKSPKISSGQNSAKFYTVAKEKHSLPLLVKSPDLRNDGVRAPDPNIIQTQVDPLTRVTRTVSNSGVLKITSANDVSVISGDMQSARVGSLSVSLPLTVQVLDDAGSPVPNFKLNMKALDGGALTSDSARTDKDGVLSFNYSLPTLAGNKRIEVSNSSLLGVKSASFSVKAVAEAPFELVNQSTALSGVVAQAPASGKIQVRVNDRYGNPAPGAQVNWSTNGGRIDVTTTTGPDGIASPAYTLPSQVGDYQITASASFAEVTQPISIPAHAAPDQADHIKIVSGDAQSGTANTALSSPLQVQVLDQFENTVAGTSVAFSSSSGSLGSSSSISDALGFASSTYQLPRFAGQANIQAYTSELNGVSSLTFSATVNPDSPQNLVPVTRAFSGTVAKPLASPIIVKVVDQYENVVQGVVVNWSSATGQLSSASSLTDSNGLANISYTLDSVSGPKTIKAYNYTFEGNRELAITGKAVSDLPSGLAIISGSGQSGVILTSLYQPLKTAVLDRFGNLVGVGVSVKISSADGIPSNPLGSTGDVGYTTSIFKLGPRAGLQSATASLPDYPGILPITYGLTALAGAPAVLTLSTPPNVSLGECTALTIQLRDAGLNPVPAVQDVIFSLTGGVPFYDSLGCGESASPVIKAGQQTAIINYSPRSVGVKTLNASSAALPSRGTPSPVGVTSVDPLTGLNMSGTNSIDVSIFTAKDLLVLSGNGQSAAAGTALSNALKVKAVDSNGIPLKGVRVFFSAALGKVTPSSQLTDINGVASTVFTVGTRTGAETVSAGNSYFTGISGVIFDVIVTPGAASSVFALGGSLDGIVGQRTSTSPVFQAVDDYGNGVPNVPMSWSASAGSFSKSTSVTGVDGITSVDFTLGTVAGAQTVTGSISVGVSSNQSAVIQANARADIAAALSILQGNSQSGVIETTLPTLLKVKIADQYGNGLQGLSLTYPATDGTISPATLTSAAGGTAEFTYQLGSLSGNKSIKISSADITGSAGSVTFSETALSGAPAQILITQAPTTGVSQKTLTTPLKVVLKDARGNLVTDPSKDKVIGLSAYSDSRCQTLATGTLVAADAATINGSGSFGLVSYDLSQTIYLKASSPIMAADCSGALSISPGSASQMKILSSTKGSGSVAGVTFSTPLVVQVTDAAGNNVTSLPSGSITVSVAGNTPLLYGTTAVTPASATGSATFSDLSVRRAGSGYSLVVKYANLSPASSPGFDVNPGPATQITSYAGSNQTIQIGTAAPNPLQFQIQDAYGNSINQATISFATPSSTGSISPASATTSSAGIVSTAFTSAGNSAGDVTVTASQGSLSGTVAVHVSIPALVSSLPSTLALIIGDTKAFTISGGFPPYSVATTVGALDSTKRTLSVSCASGTSGTLVIKDSAAPQNVLTTTVSVSGCYPSGIDGAVSVPVATTYRLEQDPASATKLRILNVNTGAAVVSAVGNYVNSGTNQQVCAVDLASLSVPAGSRFETGAECKWSLVAVAGALTNNGTIAAEKGEHAGGTWTMNLPDASGALIGALQSYTIMQASGGNSQYCSDSVYGNGSGFYSCATPATSPTINNAGGGKHGYYMPGSSQCAPSQNLPGVPVYGMNGIDGNTGNTCEQIYPGGGSRGRHGSGLVIVAVGSVSGTGLISANGQVGGRGGNAAFNYFSPGATYSHYSGGGGGAGGSGGSVILRRPSTTKSSFIIQAFPGAAGAGGAADGGAPAGYSGSSGNSGSASEVLY